VSDPIEATIRALRGQQPPGGFAPAGAVRRRGTRRTYRQLLTAAVAVLAVAGGVVTWAGTRTERHVPPVTTSVTPSSSGTPSVRPPVAFTPAMFLTAADLRPENLMIGPADEIGRDVWMWEDICKPYRRADYPSLAERVQMEVRAFRDTNGMGAGAQMIERYRPGAGPRNFDDVRARLRDCDGIQSADPVVGTDPIRWTLVVDGFAGDDSVLAKRELFQQGGPVRVLFQFAVRVGDLVSTVQLDAGVSETTARDIAAKAAARLR
jgi:hypothetical protein